MNVTETATHNYNYFANMSDALLSVWIEVAEHRLPNYKSYVDRDAVSLALAAAKLEKEKRDEA